MPIRFCLMVNKQGQTRLAQYYEILQMDERCALEAEVIRKCLSRTDTQCSFYEYRGYKVVYRRYASLFFIVGVEGEDENELAILEFIHALVETLDRYFENVVSGGPRPCPPLAICRTRASVSLPRGAELAHEPPPPTHPRFPDSPPATHARSPDCTPPPVNVLLGTSGCSASSTSCSTWRRRTSF